MEDLESRQSQQAGSLKCFCVLIGVCSTRTAVVLLIPVNLNCDLDRLALLHGKINPIVAIIFDRDFSLMGDVFEIDTSNST